VPGAAYPIKPCQRRRTYSRRRRSSRPKALRMASHSSVEKRRPSWAPFSSSPKCVAWSVASSDCRAKVIRAPLRKLAGYGAHHESPRGHKYIGGNPDLSNCHRRPCAFLPHAPSLRALACSWRPGVRSCRGMSRRGRSSKAPSRNRRPRDVGRARAAPCARSPESPSALDGRGAGLGAGRVQAARHGAVALQPGRF